MLRPQWLLLLAILAIFLPAPAWCQDPRPYVRLDFSRQNDFTFSTLLETWYFFEKGRYSMDLHLDHNNIYNTSLTSDRFVQLYLRSSLWQYYRLKPRLSLASWLETDQYFNNRNEKVSLYGGVRYRPWDFLTVTPLVGYTMDLRTAVLGQTSAEPRLDPGFTPAMLVESDHLWPDEDLSTRSRAFLRYKFIDPRRQYNVSLFHGWMKQFEEGVTLNAALAGGSHELDDYQGNAVKRIISDTLNPRFYLSYEFLPGLEWRSENDFFLFRRRFRFQGLEGTMAPDNDLTFTGMEIVTRQALAIAKKRWKAMASYEYQFSTRVYDLENTTNLNPTDYENRLLQEKQKDFLKDFHKIDLLLETQLAARHGLTARLVNQYLQYDTQSELNYDDRDELSYLGSVEWMARWRQSFYTGLGLSANYRHYAFLFSEKSQDNYIQRSLRLDWRYGWDPVKRLRIEGDNAIYVTYNVKDFTDYNKTDRSTRNLETNFRAIYRPTRRLQAELGFRRKETHQSYLNWAEFTETTLDTNTIQTFENRYRYTIDGAGKRRAWFIEAGYKHFDQTKRFKATLIGLDNVSHPVSLAQISLQTGPLLSIGFRDRENSTVEMGVWMQVQVRKNRWETLGGSEYYPSIFREEEINQPGKELRPYPNIRLNYMLPMGTAKKKRAEGGA